MWTTVANAIGATMAPADRNVCCSPIAAPLRARPAASAAAVKDRPFHERAEGPGDDESGESTIQTGASTSAASDSDRERRARARPSASGTIRNRSRSERRPTAMRAMPPRTCVAASAAAATPVGHASAVVEEEDEEAEQADLRRHVERAGDADPPDAGVAQRTSEHRVIVGRLAAEQDRADDRRREAGHGQADERCAQADLLVERGKRDSGHRSAERSGHLADAECEAALLFAEPRHDGASARGVDARAERPDSGERADELSDTTTRRRPTPVPRPSPSGRRRSRRARRSRRRRCPQSSIVASEPKLIAASTTPTWVRVSS